jgi:hypothetical protein
MYLKKVLNKKVFELYSNADVGFEGYLENSLPKHHIWPKNQAIVLHLFILASKTKY